MIHYFMLYINKYIHKYQMTHRKKKTEIKNK